MMGEGGGGRGEGTLLVVLKSLPLMIHSLMDVSFTIRYSKIKQQEGILKCGSKKTTKELDFGASWSEAILF